jgi:hypothetical protein
MQGTKRSSESTAWVADSLAKLGDNVSKALTEREQNRQAQEMLPFLQQSMQESMTLAGQGKTGEAYAKLMPFLADPSVINNPNLRQVIPAFESGIKIAGDEFYKKEQLRVREDMYNARYGGGGGEGGGGEYSVTSAEDILMGGMPAMQQPMGDMRDQLDMEAAQGLPSDQEQPSEGFSFGGGRISGQSMFQPTPDIIEDAARSIGKYQSEDRVGKQKFNSRHTTDELTDNAIPLNLPGYEGYYVVPPVLEQKLDRKVTQRFKPNEQPDTTVMSELVAKNKDRIDAFNAALQQAQSAGAFVQRSGQLSRIAGSVNGDWTRVKLDEEGPKDDRKYTAQIDNSEPIELTDDEYNNLAVLSSLPATIGAFENAGAMFIAPKPTEAPAPTQTGTPVSKEPPAQEKPISETEPLRQQLAAKQAEESKKTAAQRQKRVTEINKEIEKLQVGTIDKPTGITRMDVASIARPSQSRTTTKTSKQIERDIAKIEQLVAERDRLEGKVPATAPTQTGFTIRKIN